MGGRYREFHDRVRLCRLRKPLPGHGGVWPVFGNPLKGGRDLRESSRWAPTTVREIHNVFYAKALLVAESDRRGERDSRWVVLAASSDIPTMELALFPPLCDVP